MDKVLESDRAGLPPGTITTASVKKSSAQWYCYNEASCESEMFEEYLEFSLPNTDKQYKWGNIIGIGDSQLLQSAGKALSIHSLTLEDIAHPNQRAKIEAFDSYSYVALKMMRLCDGVITSEQLSIVFSKDWVVSFQEVEGDVFEPIRQRLRTGSGKVRKSNHDYLVYVLIDAVVDGYYSIIEDLEEKLYTLESKLLKGLEGDRIVEQLYEYKEIIRTVCKESRELSSFCSQMVGNHIDSDIYIYYRDAYDHSVRINGYADELKDFLTALFSLQSVNMNNSLNQTMKFLTVISSIFIPLTFLAGIYGMNFEVIPELKYRYGYYICLFVMLVVGLASFLIFKKKKWL